jgi:RimJ/RimL family protein N-acetyltransferase
VSPVHLEPWGPDDLELLRACVGDAAMMTHLGGPESPEKIADRQKRYQKPDSKQYRIVDDETGQAVGHVGYWEREAHGEEVYEIGWAVIPAFQGRGIAAEATRQAIELARAEDPGRRYLYAYPSVENGPSNALCRKLGFELMGAFEYVYPPGSGNVLTCNDWRYDLRS